MKHFAGFSKVLFILMRIWLFLRPQIKHKQISLMGIDNYLQLSAINSSKSLHYGFFIEAIYLNYIFHGQDFELTMVYGNSYY